jgi:GntR family transcriptional regulator
VSARLVPLERDSHVAMYRQLAQQLRDAILRGRYKADDKLPTEPQLIGRFGVSRITARQAVDALVREGLVVRKQGKGTFVTGPRVHHDLLDLRGIYDGLVAQGLDPQTRLLHIERVAAPPRVVARLGTGSRKLLHWRRLYVLRGKPFAVSVVYLNPGKTRITDDQVERNPTYSILEKLLSERISRADVSIRYEPASFEFARMLHVEKGAPLMVLERVSYNDEGVPLEHSLYRARAATYEFSLTVRGKLPITRSLKAAASF